MEIPKIAERYAEDEESLSLMLKNLIGPLVARPDRIAISTTRHDEVVSFHVEIAPADVHRLIGPEGRTAESLSIIVRAAGIKARRTFALVIHPAP